MRTLHLVHEDHAEILSCIGLIQIYRLRATLSKQSLNSGTEYSHPPADATVATQIYIDAFEWPPLPCMPCSVVGDNRLRLSLDTKPRLYQTCVLQILLYGADTWTLLANDIRGLQSFHRGCHCQRQTRRHGRITRRTST